MQELSQEDNGGAAEEEMRHCKGCGERDKIIMDLHWMARRYADLRSSYAPGVVNRATRWLLEHSLPVNQCAEGIIWARDGMGRRFDGLTEAQATPGTPEAKGEK